MKPSTLSGRDLLAAGLIVLIWGTNFVAMKIGLRSFTPFQLGAARYLFAMLPLILLVRAPRLHWKWLLLYGVCQGVGILDKPVAGPEQMSFQPGHVLFQLARGWRIQPATAPLLPGAIRCRGVCGLCGAAKGAKGNHLRISPRPTPHRHDRSAKPDDPDEDCNGAGGNPVV